MREARNAGTGIWRRIDDGFTALKQEVRGSAYLEQFPGATVGELEAANAERPGGEWIFDGNPPADTDGNDGGFEIEAFHAGLYADGTIVVRASTRPPFGEWEALDEWPD